MLLKLATARTFFVRIAITICYSLFITCSIFSQGNTTNKWDSLFSDFKSGKINDTIYLNKVQPLVEQSFKDTTLKEKLAHFKSIAWSKNEYHRYRVKYFSYLANNATYIHKEGATIYYLEKLEEELKTVSPYINSLNQPRLLLAIYSEHSSCTTKRVIEFERIFPFLKSLPDKIMQESVPEITCQNAMTILLNGARLYSDKNDSSKVLGILKAAENLWSSVDKRKAINEDKIFQSLYQYYLIKYNCRKVLSSPDQQKNILDSCYTILKSPASAKMNALWKKAAQKGLFLKYIDYFIDQKQNDSAIHYLNILTELKNSGNLTGDETSYYLSYSKLKVNDGSYKMGYDTLLKAYMINDSIIGLRTVDINNNMYALTQLEDTSEKLLQTQNQKNKRNILIICISFVFITIVAALLLLLRKKNNEIKKRIRHLNISTNLQIAELEEQKQVAKLEEKKRLGMELHDDIAGNIAYVKLKIESEILNEANDAELTKRLKELSMYVSGLYEKTRVKSHIWYNSAKPEIEFSFKKRIQSLLVNVLDDGKFKKDIIIEENAFEEIALQTKVELLHIIQEAVTNILIHAKAHLVAIHIYKDINGLVLQVMDDGIGFNTSKTTGGIGLYTIKKRVADIQGTINIESDILKGTSITVCIPTDAN